MIPSVPASSRRPCRDTVDTLLEDASVDDLLEEVDALLEGRPSTSNLLTHDSQPEAPNSPDRPPTPSATPTVPPTLDYTHLTSGKEIPGSRIEYRLSKDFDLNYGPDVDINNLASNTMLVTTDFVRRLRECNT